MVLTKDASGSTTVSSTETTIFGTTALKHYAGYIYTHNLLATDSLRVRVYVQDVDSSTLRVYNDYFITSTQTSAPTFYIPFVPTNQYQATLTNTTSASTVLITWVFYEV